MFLFLEFLDEPLTLTIVDVGAAPMSSESDVYASLLAYPNTVVYGFEPNEQACAARNASAPSNRRCLPYFIGDGSGGIFYECENPLTSSLYEPDAELLGRFQYLDLPVKSKFPVKTVRLDDTGIGDVDFLKLDIQGAELDAINGATQMLTGALVIHTEVEFVPIYKFQPLFGDVDIALRQTGFMFLNFSGLFTRQFRPMIYDDNPHGPGSQLLWAEAAIYIRYIGAANTLSREKLLKFVTIMHDVYGAFDLCAHLLEVHDKRFKATQLMNRYVTRVSSNLSAPENHGTSPAITE